MRCENGLVNSRETHQDNEVSSAEERSPMNIFLRWAQESRTTRQRISYLALGGLMFVVLLPGLLLLAAIRLDGALGSEDFLSGPVPLIAGILLILGGGALALWTIAVQVTRGTGTPFPMAPTQRLLTTGPFAWCRNPMASGTVLAYLGMSLAVGSLVSLLVVAALAALLLLYIKRVEEGELAMRFGQEYLSYKAVTPFAVPRRPRRPATSEDGGPPPERS
jgi:protein-S-isoprenylcysteine O-methyltransferase Ste14